MGGLFPADFNDDRPTQELCEQFSEVHGIPSDVETEMLGEIGNVGDEVIEAWCEQQTKQPSLSLDATDFSMYSPC